MVGHLPQPSGREEDFDGTNDGIGCKQRPHGRWIRRCRSPREAKVCGACAPPTSEHRRRLTQNGFRASFLPEEDEAWHLAAVAASQP